MDRMKLIGMILEHYKVHGPKSQEEMVKAMLKRMGDLDLAALAYEFGLVSEAV